MDDLRIIWLKTKICNLLGVFEEYADELILNNFDKIQDFLIDEFNESNYNSHKVIFIWRTFFDKLVEEEITVLEKEKRIAPVITVDTSRKKKKSKGTKFVPEVQIASPEPTFVEVKKIIQSFVKTPMLHCHFGFMTSEDIDLKITYVYIIRKNHRAIPVFKNTHECFAELPDYFLLGSAKGNFMKSMESNLKEIYEKEIKFQFHEPKLASEKAFFHDLNYKSTKPEDINLIDFSKPSQFCQKVIQLKSTLAEKDDDDDDRKSVDKFKTKQLDSTTEISIKRISKEPKLILTTEVSKALGVEPSKQTLQERWDNYFDKFKQKKYHAQFKQKDGSIERPIREKFHQQLEKFQNNIHWIVDHINWTFDLPTAYNAPGQENITFEETKRKINIDIKQQDVSILTEIQLLDIINGWMNHIKKVMKEFKEKPLQDFNSVEEYEFWRRAEMEMYSLMEQLKSDFVKTILELLNHPILENWNQLNLEMSEFYENVKENADYLSSIMGYIKRILSHEDFDFVLSLIPNLMIGLRYIWTMSNYYGKDENMQFLLIKITNIFIEKVKDFIRLDKIFSNTSKKVHEIASMCVKMLDMWKNSYFENRKYIENSGAGSRWEFNKNALFSVSDHIQKICEDISNIGKIFIHFENLFNSYLKIIINDSIIIDEFMKKVYATLNVILKISYDIFTPKNREDWEESLSNFKKKIIIVENEAKIIIEECISSLRSSNLGLEFIKTVHQMDTRQSLKLYVTDKHKAILRHFLSEIEKTKNEFMLCYRNPPRCQHQGKYISAVKWSRTLGQGIKNSMLILNEIKNELQLNDSLAEQISQRYTDITTTMMRYELHCFSNFEYESIYIVNSLMTQNLINIQIFHTEALHDFRIYDKNDDLQKINNSSKISANLITDFNVTTVSKRYSKMLILTNLIVWLLRPRKRDTQVEKIKEYLNMTSGLKAVNKFRAKQAQFLVNAQTLKGRASWDQMIGKNVLMEYEMQFGVNFNEDVFKIIRESRQFEKIGFQIARVLRKVTVDKNLLILDYKAINEIIKKYNKIVENLYPYEIDLLRNQLYEAEAIIQQGTSRYTWSSINIKEYCIKCNDAMIMLESKFTQMHNIREDIRSKINQYGEFNLFEIKSDHIASAQIMQKDSTNLVTDNEDDFENVTIKPFGDKKLDLIFPCKEYFALVHKLRDHNIRYIHKLYDSLTPTLIKLESLVLGSFSGQSAHMKMYYAYWQNEAFKAIFDLICKNIRKYISDLSSSKSLIEIELQLRSSGIVFHPQPLDIYNLFINSFKDLLQRTKFLFWYDGTCIQCKTPNELFTVNTFYNEIIQVHAIQRLYQEFQSFVQCLIKEAEKFAIKYKIFKKFCIRDKILICEKFVEKNSLLESIYEKFSFYNNAIENVEKMKTNYNAKSLLINTKPLHESIKRHAEEWKYVLGRVLLNKIKNRAMEIRDEIQNLKINLNQHVKSLDDFRIVIETAANIEHKALSMELEIKEMQESFVILKENNVQFSYSDMLMTHLLEKRWNRLYGSAICRYDKLKTVTQKLSEITSKEIELFFEEINEFIKDFDANGPCSVEDDFDKGIHLMEIYSEKLYTLDNRREELVKAEKLFDMPVSDYSEFLRVKQEMEGIQHIFKIYKQQKIARENWSKCLWTELNTQMLFDGIESYIKDLHKLPKWIKEMTVTKKLEIHMKQFRNSIFLMEKLKHEALRPRHWHSLMQQTGKFFEIESDRFTLDSMFAMNLHDYQDIVDRILNSAIKELVIENSIKNIENVWNSMRFTFERHFKGKEERGYALKDVDEIIQMLEDCSLTLHAIETSEHLGFFQDTVLKWERTLALVSDIIDEWISVQRKWLYLEGVFIDTDVRNHLPEEAKKFDELDRTYRKITTECAEDPYVIRICTMTGQLSEFLSLNRGLEECQKLLIQYLESKRAIFPRFYFISTNELLSILGSTELKTLQEHIAKMFFNINFIKFEATTSNTNIVVALISTEGEEMRFKNSVYVVGPVEEWMHKVVEEMRRTNRLLTKKAIYDYGKNREIARCDWILNYQGMICLAANQVWWTAEIEEAFDRIKKGNKNSMKEYLEQQNKQIDELVIKVRSHLTRNDRLKYKNVLTIDVHARDVVETFVTNDIFDEEEFEWQRQLRFYWLKADDNLFVFQCTGRFDYGYEYLGLSNRLVITPLTDCIYLTITQALLMFLGTSPAGPAGTGKTETVKDLSKTIAYLCIVTNCGEGMDYAAVGTILAGLAQSGAWGCFDEFNRIDPSVLSVASTQLQLIRYGLMRSTREINFQGKLINLNPRVGVFVTMNLGYAGRTELPESLKVLFRPVVCTKPDVELICIISLFSDGFLSAKILAKKMIVLYKLAEEQLSKKYHYDWGLRSMCSVLRMAAVLKRKHENHSESSIIFQALCNVNLPKLSFEDNPLFVGLIKDLFLGVDFTRTDHAEFKSSVRQTILSSGLVHIVDQEEKIIQVYETMMNRHSTMIIGPTGGGKSVIINTLVNAQNHMGVSTKCIVINPKAFTTLELYGYLDIVTRNWTDGLFSNIFREINSTSESDTKSYICFDGDIDPLWIENLNSVMDDNKLLTLANGERIRLRDHCSLLFEVGDLQYASPATISRAGMIYVDPKGLGYIPYWQKWCKTRIEIEQHKLDQLFNRWIEPGLQLIFEGFDGIQQGSPLKTVIFQNELNMITQFCNIFEAMFPQNVEKPIEYDFEALECGFFECVYASLGTCLISDHRLIFDEFMKRQSTFVSADDSQKDPAVFGQYPTEKSTLFEYFFDINKNEWIAWDWIVPEYIHDRKIPFNDIVVPTVETIKIEKFLSLMTQIKKPCLLVGENGAAKSTIALNFFKNLDPEIYVKVGFNFSSRTSSLDVQKTIEASVEKLSKDTFGPPLGKEVCIFIDDMNMPQLDTYGTQQPIALLKLTIERNGMYDRSKDLNWKSLRNINYYSAMSYPGGGRNEVDSRLLSLFTVCNVTFPEEQSLFHIYGSIFKGHLGIFSESLLNVADKIVQMTLNLFKLVKSELLAIPAKFHYTFNLRDLSRIFAGLCQIHPDYFKKVREILRVWRNEFIRIICDRLIDEHDLELMKNHITVEIKEHFSSGEDSETIEGTDENISLSIVDYALRDPLLFGDFRNAIDQDKGRFYEDLLDYKAVYSLFDEIIEEFSSKRKKLELVLFEDCLEHLTRIHRSLRMFGGHVLLIGLEGSGKKTLTRLSAFAAGCEIFEIKVSRGYNEMHFREDLKKLLRLTGVEQKKIVFMFTASQILSASFLELIDNILKTGIPSTIYSSEEKDEIIASCRAKALHHGYMGSKDSVWQYFIKSCSENLHIVLCLSPSGKALRNHCRNFPGLVNRTYIDWIFPWPKEALETMARTLIAENHLVAETYRNPIVDHIVYVHHSVKTYSNSLTQQTKRRNFITPKHYLDHIMTFLRMLNDKNNYHYSQSTKLKEGIGKIEEATSYIEKLRITVEEQEKNVREASELAKNMLNEIEISKTEASTKHSEAFEKSKEIEKQNIEITNEKNEAERILSDALPALQEARAALANLEKNDITEIRSFATPPEPVQIICGCVAILKGLKDFSWKSSKGMMADVNFLRSLIEMKVELLTTKQVNTCKAQMKLSSKLDEMKHISKAGYGLLKFVKAVIYYFDLYSEVKPKKDRVNYLVREQEAQIKKLTKLNNEINALEIKLTDLNAQYENAVRKNRELEEATKEAENRLITSNRLLKGLDSEFGRWNQELHQLELDSKGYIGECLISASFLAYLGPFIWEFRKQMVHNDWLNDIINRKIPITLPFNVVKNLSTDVETSAWKVQSLPDNEYSFENGIIATKASRFPICIDPQMQAINWIKIKERKNNLKILSFSNVDFLRQLEVSILYGIPVLFQDIDDYIDPIIYDVLAKDVQIILGQKYITLGDKEIEFHENFRLYLTTKLTNPNFDAAIYAKGVVIDFRVTVSGLEDQLLSHIIRFERSDLEEQRENLIKETSKNKQILEELEKSLLRELVSSKENFLENSQLIETLENSKIKASAIHEQLNLAEITTKGIEMVRNTYRFVAERGAILFFVLCDMSEVNVMYQFSLDAFIDIFQYALKKSEINVDLNRRLHSVMDNLTRKVYEYGCVGIFEKHKLLFAFEITTKLEERSGNLNQNEYEFFIKGSVLLEKDKQPKTIDWLTFEEWNNIQKLSIEFPEPFDGLSEHIQKNSEKWKKWFKSENPEEIPSPGNYNVNCTPFQKLLFIRCFRIDRVIRCVTEYIRQVMGEFLITPPAISLETIYEQSLCTKPVLFIISPGSDPMNDLLKLAEKHKISHDNFQHLSLGQGQENIAISLLKETSEIGQWLIFQNAHLLLSVIQYLEKYLDEHKDINQNFRLWMTTDLTPSLPIGILQKSLKVVIEAPSELKSKLRYTFTKLQDSENKSYKEGKLKTLVYVLGFFHAVMQERKKYGKLGWNISYDFNDSDFESCFQIMQTYWEKISEKRTTETLWEPLKFLFREVIYGGRVTDDFDKRIVRTYLDEYMGEFVFDTFQSFYFYQDKQNTYTVPSSNEDIMDCIDKLPQTTFPSMLGLHSNVEIGYYAQSIKDIWRHLANLQSKQGIGSDDANRGEFINNLIITILEKLPSTFDITQVRKQFQMNTTPTEIVLIQELERFNVLIIRIQQTLEILKKAIAGEIEMDVSIENCEISLYNGEIPEDWKKVAPETQMKLSHWLDHLQKRATQYMYWSLSGEPLVMWLSGLHIPASYLTAIVQIACKKNSWSLEKSTSYTLVTKFMKPEDVEERQEIGCFIYGLHLEGAHWDKINTRLAFSEPGTLIEEFPILSVIPIEIHKLKLQNTFRTPVYMTSNRRNSAGKGFVFEADLPTDKHNSYWILQNVCLILNQD